MPIQSSGQISKQDIVDEFGGTAPHAMSEYYRGGSEVGSGNTNVPTSGEIQMSDFYGAQDAIVHNISSNATNQDARVYSVRQHLRSRRKYYLSCGTLLVVVGLEHNIGLINFLV